MDLEPLRIALFHSKYVKDEDTGCWEWVAALNAGGYGLFKLPDACKLAHRVSYWIHKGPFDESLDIMHKCDNPGCVNPDHLQIATHAMNMADRIAKGRARASQRKRKDLKLTPESAAQIKFLLEQGLQSQRSIGRLFGVSQNTVRYIGLGRLWADVKPAPYTQVQNADTVD